MSEKALRKGIEDYMQALGPSAQQAAWDLIEEALADEPDLAGVLRYANELRDAAIAGEKPGGLAVADALLYIIEYITDEIGLRLTEAGWEWTYD
jgi:hypothetical protein